MRPLLLDLFCGAGGAAMGYHRAGFDVVGIDMDAQPHYPFPFIQADALAPPIRIEAFDAIHASPPCQGYSTMTNRHGSDSPLLIDAVRRILERSGLLWVIENVVGARSHMGGHAVQLTGEQFGLRVYRPRLFDSNWLMMSPPAAKRQTDPVAVYGERGDGRLLWTRNDGTELRCADLATAREAMGMPWADWHGVKEAIPPAYTEHIGAQMIGQL